MEVTILDEGEHAVKTMVKEDFKEVLLGELKQVLLLIIVNADNSKVVVPYRLRELAACVSHIYRITYTYAHTRHLSLCFPFPEGA